MRTIMMVYAVSNSLVTVIMFWFWRENRRRFKGISFWLADFVMQTAGIVLLLLRGCVPAWLSIVCANVLITGGIVVFYEGLSRFTGVVSRHLHNYVILGIFTFLFVYYGLIVDNLNLRQAILSFTLIILCAQCALLLLTQIDVRQRNIYRLTGTVILLYCLLLSVRLGQAFVAPGSNEFMQHNPFDAIIMIVSQMLGVALTFGLMFMVNGRLFQDISDLASDREKIVKEVRILARCDTLTGIYNRLKMEEVLTNEVARALRYERKLSIIIVDIDHFKDVNDTYGHLEGDRVLQGIAWTMASEIRASDFLGRWGGEEFLIISPEIGGSGAHRLAEKLRKAVEKKELPEVGHRTASFGIASIRRGDTVDDLLIRADKALYRAKREGRNRVARAR